MSTITPSPRSQGSAQGVSSLNGAGAPQHHQQHHQRTQSSWWKSPHFRKFFDLAREKNRCGSPLAFPSPSSSPAKPHTTTDIVSDDDGDDGSGEEEEEHPGLESAEAPSGQPSANSVRHAASANQDKEREDSQANHVRHAMVVVQW